MKTAIRAVCVVAIALLMNSAASGDLPEAGVLADFAVFGHLDVTLGDGVTVRGGPIGNNDPGGSINATGGLVAPGGVFGRGTFSETGGASLGRIVMNGPVNLGNDSQVAGNIDAGDNVFVLDRSLIDGNLTATGLVSIGWSSVTLDASHVTGALYAGAGYLLVGGSSVGSIATSGTPLTVTAVAMPTESTPGPYTPIDVGDGFTLALSTGEYYYDSIAAGDSFTLALDLTGGDVSIFVKNKVKIGDGVTVTTTGSGAVYAYTNGDWTLGNGGNWTGTIYAPTGDVTVGSDCWVNGNLYGYNVNVGADSTITNEPIPAPPAVVLGAIGLGLVIRRRTSGQAERAAGGTSAKRRLPWRLRSI